MVDTDDTRRTTDDGRRTPDAGRRTTPWVWHKLPTGELMKLKANLALKIKVKVTNFQTRPKQLDTQ